MGLLRLSRDVHRRPPTAAGDTGSGHAEHRRHYRVEGRGVAARVKRHDEIGCLGHAEAGRTVTAQTITASPALRIDRRNWRAAALLGLISSSYSTLISQFSAAQLGRDAAVDWMSVAAIPARDWALQSEPSWSRIAIGIAFHQWADFSWALVFFGLFGRWTARLSPTAIAVLALPWAVLTSALEWFLLVPIFPFAQPIFTLQQPYWIGWLVHTASAIAYPVFRWIRWPGSAGDARFLKFWCAGLAVALAAVVFAAAANGLGYQVPWS